MAKAVVRYDFRAAHRNADSLEITGNLPLPAGGVAGRTVRVDIDGVVREFTLDRMGRGRSGPDAFRIVAKPGAGEPPFSLVLRKAALSDVAGVGRATESGQATMLVDLFVDRAAHRATVDLTYLAQRNGGVASFVAR